MLLLLFSLLLGIFVGILAPLHLPLVLGKYFSVAVLAALDSVLGGGKAVLEDRFNVGLFISGFITNTLLAALLTYVGDRLGVELYLAAVITFGVRIFQDLSILRVDIYRRFSTNLPQGNEKSTFEST